ncbi:hypothetical protein BCR36DRAFT_104005 [Piromyces finnis]|uniref:Right handed beta helix domain-containing protein n=1 Tax=Piromyces finnis TaxID=1754191 RepID=A0A1Y1V3M8_9FUNG|nr:hypothetical protein BCR36DRAFT_104005 [Piromyces finnis]|eukprot:ORX46457.1 hypothetical protein BCR36DRAFT_104005 [Piromyces finnis]
MTNAKALLHFMYKDIYLHHIEINNVKCLGESSLFLFESENNEITIDINNINVNNCITNGSFIKIHGQHNNIIINDSNLTNILSYGPIIDITSNTTSITISNSKFDGNKNRNKYKCGGCMHFNNDLNINIVNNTFSNNISDSNGGVICIDSIDNTLNLDLNLTSNTFEKNEGVNGGAIYINDNNNSLEKRNDRSYIMIINDNIFKENKAENYGGALYSRINTTISSISHSKNNIFKHNKSGILGGAIYSQNSREYNILDLQYNNENVFKDNTANDIINDYTSKPAYISLNTTINTWGNRITSGNFYLCYLFFMMNMIIL